MGNWVSIDEQDFGQAADKVIRVGKNINQSNNQEFVSIRQWYNDGTGWKPGKSGINIPIVDSQASAKVVLLAALKRAGVTKQQIIDEFDFEEIVTHNED